MPIRPHTILNVASLAALALLGVPSLSAAAIPHVAWLDFGGDPTAPYIPTAYAGSADEAKVRDVAASYYADYDFKIATSDPGVPAIHVWVGDSGMQMAVGGFADQTHETAYVFANMVGEDATFTGRVAAHEIGHLLGLAHQSTWSNGQLVDTYAPGALMGYPYGATADWVVGTNEYGLLQDDRAVLLSTLGAAAAVPSAAVPEPGSVAVIACVAIACRRRAR